MFASHTHQTQTDYDLDFSKTSVACFVTASDLQKKKNLRHVCMLINPIIIHKNKTKLVKKNSSNNHEIALLLMCAVMQQDIHLKQ